MTPLTVIALVWISSVSLWPGLAALIASSMVWANDGTSGEVITVGILAWAALLLARRRWRSGRVS